MTSVPVLSIVVISLIHILIGGVDQFFVQLILWKDHTFQRFRNLGFLFPDVLHVILSVQQIAIERQKSWKCAFTVSELKYGSVFVLSGFVAGKCLFT
jgi:hypothetical protein